MTQHFLIIFNCLCLLLNYKTVWYGKITTEEVMDKLDMFQFIFVNIDKFGCWDLEKLSADVGK